MLSGNNYGVNTHRLVVFVILHGNLSFSVRTKMGENAAFTHFLKFFCELVRKGDGERHELGCFVACVAEHHSLVTGAV